MSDVTTSGPFFDGRADSYSARLVNRISHDVAAHGQELVRANLTSVLRAPKTPYAEQHVQLDVSQADVEIYDDNVIYGPWLEGVGSRNSPVTRFPGYATFRRTTQQVEAAVDESVKDALETYYQEMNS
jgi:hypothetical protein